MGNITEDFLNEPVSLETKLKVSNDMAFMSLVTDLGYRTGMWSPEEEETYKKLMKKESRTQR
jgi:hypothetical protein